MGRTTYCTYLFQHASQFIYVAREFLLNGIYVFIICYFFTWESQLTKEKALMSGNLTKSECVCFCGHMLIKNVFLTAT